MSGAMARVVRIIMGTPCCHKASVGGALRIDVKTRIAFHVARRLGAVTARRRPDGEAVRVGVWASLVWLERHAAEAWPCPFSAREAGVGRAARFSSWAGWAGVGCVLWQAACPVLLHFYDGFNYFYTNILSGQGGQGYIYKYVRGKMGSNGVII